MTEKELWDFYPPFWARNVWTGEKREDAEPYVGVGKGWYPLLMEILKVVKEECEKTGLDIYATQIKEKFGGLRCYINVGTEKVFKKINEMEELSYETCEVCGSKDNVTTRGGWLKTYCEKHHTKEK